MRAANPEGWNDSKKKNNEASAGRAFRQPFQTKSNETSAGLTYTYAHTYTHTHTHTYIN